MIIIETRVLRNVALVCILVLTRLREVCPKDNRFSLAELQAVYREYECEGLAGETDTHTEKLMKDCQQLMQTPVMQSTRDYVLNAPVEELEKARKDYYARFDQREKRSVEKNCPSMSLEYRRRHDRPGGMISTSPYKYKLDYNPHRYPKYINQAYCLCDGCIDHTTGREVLYSRNLPLVSSEVVSRHHSFFTTPGSNVYRWGKVDVATGCACHFGEIV